MPSSNPERVRTAPRKYRATVGAIEFELHGRGVAVPPAVRGSEVTKVEGQPLLGVVEDGHAFLVLDWRSPDAAGGPAYAEFWRTCTQGSPVLRGLLVLSPCAPPSGAAPSYASLSGLADALA